MRCHSERKVACFICRIQWQHLHTIYLFATVLIIPDEVPQIQTKYKPKTNCFANSIHLFMHLCILCICHRNTPELINVSVAVEFTQLQLAFKDL